MTDEASRDFWSRGVTSGVDKESNWNWLKQKHFRKCGNERP